MELYRGEICDRSIACITISEIQEIATNQYFGAKLLVKHNNFYSQYVIFESTREAIAKNKELEFNPIALHNRGGCATSCFEALSFHFFFAFLIFRSLPLLYFKLNTHQYAVLALVMLVFLRIK